MPLQRCETDGRPGFRWGQAGRCYTFRRGNAEARTRARGKALRQGRAIEASARLQEGHRLVTLGRVRPALERNERQLLVPVRRLMRRLSQMISVDEWRVAAAERRLPDLDARLTNVLAMSEEEMAAVLRVPRSLTEQVDASGLARLQIAERIREIGDEAIDVVRAQLAVLLERGSHEEILRTIAQTTGLTTQQLAAVERAREAALAQGLSARQASAAADRVRRRLLDYRARLIARTEAARFTNALIQARGDELVGQGERVTRQWLSARDANVDGGDPGGPCARNDNGERFGLGEIFPSGDARPPAHPGCLPGDALVTATPAIAAQTERWYDGDLVVIGTTNDQDLTCTPNHPILTDRGWVAASLLHVGAHVVGHQSRQGVATTTQVDNQHVPARIKEIADTFRRAREVSSVPVPLSAPDFHGDGVDGQVAIIRANRSLWDGPYADVAEYRLEEMFVGRPAGSVAFTGQRHANPLAHEMTPTRGRLVSGFDLGMSLPGVHAGPFDAFGLGSTPRRDGVIQEQAPQGGTADLLPLRKSLLRHTGQIVLYDVISVRRVPFAGHVYNLQTQDGWYAVSGIITHNCRCVLELWVEE